MSLKKKIIISFIISVSIITILAVFEYSNFIEIRKEIRHIEITDIIRSTSLQLRRHEKNYFLNYSKAKEESVAVRQYLYALNSIINDSFSTDEALFHNLRAHIKAYEYRFTSIESSAKDLSKDFAEIKASHPKSYIFFPMIEAILIEHPLQGSEFLERLFSLPPDSKLIVGLKALDVQINTLRKNGEDILVVSEELDRVAREHVEKTIQLSQLAIFIFFPLFFITGIGTILFFNRDVVKRLKALIEIVEKTGKGSFSKISFTPGNWRSNDEVGTLIQKFNTMEEQLAQREEELGRKNKELFQSRKLAAIGTLASGVAHELNNPLNNIYISTQVLVRKVGDGSPADIKEVVADIRSQTLRVKSIVGDLLEFARGKEPQLKEVNLYNLIQKAYELTGNTVSTEKIRFTLDSDTGVIVYADTEQMERVFINLFTNAVDAMTGEGDLTVRVVQEDNSVTIKVSDSGKGMSGEALEKIFEPFYTTKDKGTGLGLAIVFNIINKHNGKISIQSDEGKGTTFTITLAKEPRIDRKDYDL
jgi:two-component system, NtrC family, sensor kinase